MALITRVTEGTLLEQDPWLGINSAGIDPDDHLYRKLGAGKRELPGIVQERMLRIAWQMYESNPLAHGVVETIKDHVVGDGFRVESPSEALQKVIDRHWFDWQNNWPLKQHDRVRELGMLGEQLYLLFTNKEDGHTRLASIDPINIRHVVQSDENPEEVVGVVLNGRGSEGIAYRHVHPDEDPNSETFGRLVGAKEGETIKVPRGKKWPVEGTCLFFGVNKMSSATRGRSDILSALDWLDVFDQVHMNNADRTLLMNAFIWDVTLEGATKTGVDQWLAAHGQSPKPGTVRVHNEKEKWAEVSPSGMGGGGGRGSGGEVQKDLKSQVLSANILPPHWFGEQDANRATAVEMGSPTLKHLAARQLFCVHMFSTVIRYQIDQSIIARPDLDNEWREELEEDNEDADPPFTVVAPEMSPRDMAKASQSLAQVSNALVLAMNQDIVDREEAQSLFAIVASQVGAEIDLEAMRQRMESEAEEAMTMEPSEDEVDEAMELIAQVRRNGT